MPDLVPRRSSRLRVLFASAALFGSLFASPLGGCATGGKPVRQTGLHRDTPSATYEYLKAMVEATQVAAEWQTFSPGFKRRLSEQVGRTVDLSDYGRARATIASNATKEMKLVLSSDLVGEKMLSENVATVEIRSGDRRATPRFVKLWTFEVKLKGDPEPVSEFIPGPEGVVDTGGDGSIKVDVVPSDGTRAYLKEIRKDQLESFTIKAQWYLDDFGGVEDAVASGLRGETGGGSAPRPAPRGAQPPRPAPPPPAPQKPGSPDGGIGSPG